MPLITHLFEMDQTPTMELLARQIKNEIIRNCGYASTAEKQLVGGAIRLQLTEEGLGLRLMDRQDLGPLLLDYSHPILKNRVAGTGKSSPLIRALGVNVQQKVIWDASLGLGVDALCLLRSGARVVGFERELPLYLLVWDALRRLKISLSQNEGAFPVDINRLEICFGETRDFFKEFEELEVPDIIYFDPMFPEEKAQSAAPKKELQYIRAITACRGIESDDPESFLKIARQIATDRVVVKRPPHAPPLGSDVSHAFETKLVRYDMYLS